MQLLMATIVGGLFAAGLFLVMQRHALRLVLGLVILTHAANLLIFTSGGIVRAQPPIIPENHHQPQRPIANPLTQAVILTAIVIGLATQAFVLVLVRRVTSAAGTADLGAMRSEDDADASPPTR